MTEWKIQPRANACQGCGKGFADKAPYYTLLFDKRHNLDRLDVCPECWAGQYSQGAHDRKGFVSFWQGVFNVPPPPAPEPIQKESAETLLRKLVEMNDPKYQAACFILSVMLERKRMFKVKTQGFEDGQRILYYEHIRTGDLFTILDPGLQLQQLEAVQHEVADLLKQGLPAGDHEPAAAEVRTEIGGDLAVSPGPDGDSEDPAEPAPPPAPTPPEEPAAEPAVESAGVFATDLDAESVLDPAPPPSAVGVGPAGDGGEKPAAA